MKILHLGDLHLGKSLGDFDLFNDQKFILDQILELIDMRSVDTVLIAGDVYDKSIPSEAATRLLDSFLVNLTKRKVKTFIISGNHDSDDRLNFGSQLFESNDIYISSVFDGKLHKYPVNDNGNEVNIYMLPFVKASQVRHFYPDSKIESYEDAVRTVLDDTEIDNDKVNILVAHQFVTGSSAPQLAGSEGASVKNVGLVEQINSELLKNFDYVALGHLHSPQSVGYDHIRYSGRSSTYHL